MEAILSALRGLRAPLQQGEYDLHALVMDTLSRHDLSFTHEARLAPRCRIDLMCEGGVGIEIKRGKPEPRRIQEQLRRYAACEQVSALILVTERTVAVPQIINGKPVAMVCLNRLWGIAL